MCRAGFLSGSGTSSYSRFSGNHSGFIFLSLQLISELDNLWGLAPWPSAYVCALHWGSPVFPRFESWVRTWHHSSSHAEVASHMPQLEGPTTKNIQLCTGGSWEKKEKKIKSLKKKKRKTLWEKPTICLNTQLQPTLASSPNWVRREQRNTCEFIVYRHKFNKGMRLIHITTELFLSAHISLSHY